MKLDPKSLIKGKIVNFLPENLSRQQRQEIEVFDDDRGYQALMNRPYFLDLKRKVHLVLSGYHFRQKSILEIGAGRSDFLDLFSSENFLVALDLNEKLLSKNQEKATLVVADARKLPFKNESFDFVYLVGILHHLYNQRQALREIRRVLKKDGRFFFSEPTKISLNWPYFWSRQLLLKIFGKERVKRWIGCATPNESFVNIEAIKEVFSDYQLEFREVMPLRWPPLTFLEKISLAPFNRLLEKIPGINKLGTIVFIRGERKDNSLGFGTEYEKMVLKKIARRICRQYKIKTVWNWPANDLLGKEAIFPFDKGLGRSTLVWNFCEFENAALPDQLLRQMSQKTKRYLLVITQNNQNPGVWLHRLVHLFTGRNWDHGKIGSMGYRAVIGILPKFENLKIVEVGAFDLPWFILDVYETGRLFRNWPIFKSKIRETKESRWEDWPLWLKLKLCHHHFVLLRKK